LLAFRFFFFAPSQSEEARIGKAFRSTTWAAAAKESKAHVANKSNKKNEK
jgi:hypothetical protein